ncbi:hypothetical protein AB6G03_18610 [Providencia hangzhouensis]|uniref:hypothetical protein n=1 Tax=Providencia hangzhouensis TaxID=3031799 RepID=UPI0034DD1F0E
MIDTAFKTPSFFIIGWGKDYFGAEITATDNEHLYIALVYGPIIWLALIIVAFLAGFKYTILFLKTSNKNYLFKSFNYSKLGNNCNPCGFYYISSSIDTKRSFSKL